MAMKAANPKTQQALDFWLNHEPVVWQMPVVFRANAVSWHSLTCSCSRCDQDIPDEDVRGTLTNVISSVVTMRAIGWCRQCNLLVPFDFRFRDTGAIEWQQDGQWVRTYGKRVTWWDRLMDRLKPLKMLWENLL